MQCVKCQKETRVLQTRDTRRRRECMTCGFRFNTAEVVVMKEQSRSTPVERERKVRVFKAEPTISKAKEKAIARKAARDRIEERKWDKEYEWNSEYDNFLPDRW